jgi:osmotically-inducible protein OsmY
VKRLAMVVLVGVAAAGCHESAKSARQDAEEAAREARDAAEEARKAVREAGQDAREAMQDAKGAMREAERDVRDAPREAGREARTASREAAADLHDAKQLLDVRAALAVSNEIASTDGITVRTDAKGEVLYLEGTVGTAAEKSAAERIAREHADGLRVSNRLHVSR